MKIGILGGSFDPIHEGHLILARESERQFKLDKILFTPALVSPLKTESPSLTPAPLRARMVEMAIRGRPSWQLCDLELVRSGPSYTVETLRELRNIYPSPHELFFIGGVDAYEDLKNWKNPEEILKLSEWIIAPRPSHPLPKNLPPRFHPLQMRPIAISSTEIRHRAGQGKDVSVWVPRRVHDYLRQMKIYEEKKK